MCRRSEEMLLANYLIEEASASMSLPQIVEYEELEPEALSDMDMKEEIIEYDNNSEEELFQKLQPPQFAFRNRKKKNSLEAQLKLPAEGPWVCQPCNREYTKKSSYLSHYRDIHHERLRRFLCTICGASYTREAALKGHLNVHNNVKPFKCDICNMGFARKYAVQHHMRSHTKEKKYHCSYCQRGFSFYTDVKRHETIHTGIFLYPCNLCTKGFNRKKQLLEHEESVHVQYVVEDDC